jgi:alanine racemase
MDGGASGAGETSNDVNELLASASIPTTATGVLIADLAALRRNYRKLRGTAAPAECAAVLKGDGYGLGAVPVAKALQAEGCRTFFVATFAEADALRSVIPDAALYVLDGLTPGSSADFVGRAVCPVLGGLDEVEEWAAFCAARGEELASALHIDTGMNRLGLKAADQEAVLARPERLKGAGIALLMTHLACADTPDHPKNREQLAEFEAFTSLIGRARRSVANSGGVFLGPDFHFDLVRPGIALYGGNPFAARANPMEPVVRLLGRILQVGAAAAGETIGYGAAQTLRRPTRYATVSVGYADGYLRALSATDTRPGALGHVDGVPVPMLGRVSMDLIMFDVTDLPPEKVRRGGFIELIGAKFTVDDAARLAGTIGYEILTGLGPRYTRVHIGADEENGHV